MRALALRLAVPCAAALAASACGGAGARAQAGAVTSRFYAAVRSGDARSACALLDDATRQQLESQAGAACPRALGSVQLHDGRLTRVQVYITDAKADLSSGESAFLDEGPQGWRLSAIGCRPQGGKPADRPYDCEVES